MTKKTAPEKQAESPERDSRIAAVLVSMETGNSLRQSCVEHDLPIGTFLRWVDEDKELAEHYTQARARMLDAQAEALEEIGDEAAQAETAVQVAGLRLKSDNRKWLLSKLAPKKYGEKLAVGGADDLPPLRAEISDLKGLNADELGTLKRLLAKGKEALDVDKSA